MSVSIRETNFELPGQVGEPYHGKVRDTYTIEHEAGELLVAVSSDRISAFDVVLPEQIPYKGQVLNQLSARLLQDTRDVVSNWLINSPDPNVTIGQKAQAFPVEMIMRGLLLGTALRSYQQGNRNLCGNKLPDGMSGFEAFESPLLTPTTKAEAGHDENITPDQIIANGLATADEFEEMEHFAREMFYAGQVEALRHGLVLADTKYEFGKLATGQIIVIDEVHTPDSSRYYPQSEISKYGRGELDREPLALSKEFVRDWLRDNGFEGEPDQTPPDMPADFVESVSARYINLYENRLGEPFVPADADSEADRLDQMRERIVTSLGNLTTPI